MRPSPPNPAKFDADALQAIANIQEARRLYRAAYELGYTSERRGSEKILGTRDEGGPTALAASNQETVRDKLSTVADLVTGENGARGKSGAALSNLRSLADHGRYVMRDWEVKPGSYATSDAEKKAIGNHNAGAR
jgi:hypothetical protein